MFSAKRRRQPQDALVAPRVSRKGSRQFADHNMVLSTQDPVGFFQTALTKRVDPLPIFFFLDDGPCGLCLYFISFRSFIVLIFTGKLFYVMTPLGNLNLSVSNLIISALECPPKRASFVFYLLAYKQIKLTRVVLEDPQEI